MNDSTVKTSIEFGHKVSYSRNESFSYSTAVALDETALIHSRLYSSGTYKTIDYSDEKKRETYRKVNKMLGGN